MNRLKNLLLMMILFGLHGCFSTSSSYYILSVASIPSQTYIMRNKVIGVAKISVPAYLYKRDIAIAKSSNEITLLGNARWGEDLDTGLTNRLIEFLQKKFNQPNVYPYPWGIDKQPNIKVSVQITRFIAQGDSVYLEATWNLENMKTRRKKARLFSTRVDTKSDIRSVVFAMNKAFMEFEEAVALGIKRF
ncbi:MAG: hypothetical protein DSZ08_08085 [Sulfurovum sp.]|nr:MAG: hypothetical protein DSZ08_08085 [Sulfurovum sp.]